MERKRKRGIPGKSLDHLSKRISRSVLALNLPWRSHPKERRLWEALNNRNTIKGITKKKKEKKGNESFRNKKLKVKVKNEVKPPQSLLFPVAFQKFLF